MSLAVGQAAASVSGAALSERFGPRRVFAVGLALVAAALAAFSSVHLGPVAVALLALLLGIGAGFGLENEQRCRHPGRRGRRRRRLLRRQQTVRRLAGGIGGQTSTILLASSAVASSPNATASFIAFLIAAGLSLAGCVLVVAYRGRPTQG